MRRAGERAKHEPHRRPWRAAPAPPALPKRTVTAAPAARLAMLVCTLIAVLSPRAHRHRSRRPHLRRHRRGGARPRRPDRHGRPRRSVVGARGRGQHRPRGHDDPRARGAPAGPAASYGPWAGPASPARRVRRRSAACCTRSPPSRFGVDQIVSGVAINILGLGVTQYLAELLLDGTPGGGQTQSPPIPPIRQAFTAPVHLSTPLESIVDSRAGSSSPTSPAIVAGLITQMLLHDA